MHTTSRTDRTIGSKISLAITSAMTAALIAGCTTNAAPSAELSASKAETALARGDASRAIASAEAAVAADPRNAGYRATLGTAYFEAGRFASAVTTFDDAHALGDRSAGSALRLALALVGIGEQAEAVSVLDEWSSAIAASDLGLAYALAGQPVRGIELMADGIRAGDDSAKMRQNLAYALALQGHWKEARVMASQDVPADKLDVRMQEWAQLARAEAAHLRVAALVGAPLGVIDGGQPVHLALSNTPGIEQLAAEAAALAVSAPPPAAAGPAVELAPITPFAAIQAPVPAEPAPRSEDSFVGTFAAIAPATEAVSEIVSEAVDDAARFVKRPVVQALSAMAEAARPAPVAAQRADHQALGAQAQSGTHLVQLGSFGSDASARRAWSIYTKRYPELAAHEMVITEAVVSGKRYWRVSAGGFSASSSRSMCGKVKNRGEGCFAYAENRPLPGAVDTGVRLARR